MQLWLAAKASWWSVSDHWLPFPAPGEPGLSGPLGSCPLLLKCRHRGQGGVGGASHNFLQRDREAEEAETLVLPSSTAPRRGLLSLLAAGGGERMQSVLSDPQTPGCGGEGTR